jgi:hypothetical protein
MEAVAPQPVGVVPLRGSAYVAASSGMVAWNDVSNAATVGTSGTRSPTARIAATARGLCSGARSAIESR